MTSAVLLLVLPILIGWAATILLHVQLNTDFFMLLLNLVGTSATWANPVTRVSDMSGGMVDLINKLPPPSRRW